MQGLTRERKANILRRWTKSEKAAKQTNRETFCLIWGGEAKFASVKQKITHLSQIDFYPFLLVSGSHTKNDLNEKSSLMETMVQSELSS